MQADACGWSQWRQLNHRLVKEKGEPEVWSSQPFGSHAHGFPGTRTGPAGICGVSGAPPAALRKKTHVRGKAYATQDLNPLRQPGEWCQLALVPATAAPLATGATSRPTLSVSHSWLEIEPRAKRGGRLDRRSMQRKIGRAGRLFARVRPSSLPAAVRVPKPWLQSGAHVAAVPRHGLCS